MDRNIIYFLIGVVSGAVIGLFVAFLDNKFHLSSEKHGKWLLVLLFILLFVLYGFILALIYFPATP